MNEAQLQVWEDYFLRHIDQDIVHNFNREGNKVHFDRYWCFNIDEEAYIPVDMLKEFFKPQERKKWAKIQKDDYDRFYEECCKREGKNYRKMAEVLKKDIIAYFKYLAKSLKVKPDFFKVEVDEDDYIWLNVDIEVFITLPPDDIADKMMEYFRQ
jgi:hypothetical protein